MQKQFTITHTNMAKGLAVLLLLSYHLFKSENQVIQLNVMYRPFSLQGFLTLANFGNVCVSVFVFLTAFGIATGLLAQEGFIPATAYRQAVRRFVLLMLNFAVLYLSVNLLWWYKFDYPSLYGSGKQGVLALLTDGLGLSMFFGTPTLNETWWYMEVAYVLIFLIPLLTCLVRKIGYSLLPAAFFAPFAITFHPDVKRYLFVAAFGVCAAYGKWPDRLLNLKIHPALRWLIGIAGFILCVLVRQNYIVHEYYIHLLDAPIALFIIYLSAAVLGTIPLLGRGLNFIGKHSMNIFLVHSFFYLILWQPYIYYFKYAWSSFLLLLMSCLFYSVLLELLKRICGFKRLLARF